MASRHPRRAAEPLEFLERYGREYFDELDVRKVTLKSRIKHILLWLSTPAPGYPLNLVCATQRICVTVLMYLGAGRFKDALFLSPVIFFTSLWFGEHRASTGLRRWKTSPVQTLVALYLALLALYYIRYDLLFTVNLLVVVLQLQPTLLASSADENWATNGWGQWAAFVVHLMLHCLIFTYVEPPDAARTSHTDQRLCYTRSTLQVVLSIVSLTLFVAYRKSLSGRQRASRNTESRLRTRGHSQTAPVDLEGLDEEVVPRRRSKSVTFNNPSTLNPNRTWSEALLNSADTAGEGLYETVTDLIAETIQAFFMVHFRIFLLYTIYRVVCLLIGRCWPAGNADVHALLAPYPWFYDLILQRARDWSRIIKISASAVGNVGLLVPALLGSGIDKIWSWVDWATTEMFATLRGLFTGFRLHGPATSTSSGVH